MLRPLALAVCLTAAPPAAACDIALLLAIDVSGSVDAAEYRLQVDGTADALADPQVIEALVAAEAAVSVMQWSGAGMQLTVLPWTRVAVEADALTLSAASRALPRAFDGSDTALGDAILAAAAAFGQAPACRRKVIDISGDGPQNAGGPVAAARRAAIAADIAINAIAIEDIGLSLTAYFRAQVITRQGFVVTARGHSEYPAAIREKLLREIEQPAF
jgi:Ca-activated chloride channel family protein